jgi:quinolinate synthase
MKLNTLEKIYAALLNDGPEVTVPAEIAEKALKPLQRMLDWSV